MPYHKKEIPKGILGEFSKIKEEFLEAEDAFNQDCYLMVLIELSDIFGAIEEYVLKYGMNMQDIKRFSDITKSAFKDGSRS